MCVWTNVENTRKRPLRWSKNIFNVSQRATNVFRYFRWASPNCLFTINPSVHKKILHINTSYKFKISNACFFQHTVNLTFWDELDSIWIFERTALLGINQVEKDCFLSYLIVVNLTSLWTVNKQIEILSWRPKFCVSLFL